ncbi:MAG: DUF2508 family protein [bacterium]
MEIANIKSQFSAILEWFRVVWQDFIIAKEEKMTEELSLKDYLNLAKKDWQEALEYFDHVTEPELVDHASFLLRAAESKYIYLLKKYKEEIHK